MASIKILIKIIIKKMKEITIILKMKPMSVEEDVIESTIIVGGMIEIIMTIIRMVVAKIVLLMQALDIGTYSNVKLEPQNNKQLAQA